MLTSVPMVLLVLWIPVWLGRLWRRALWSDASGLLVDAADSLGAPLVPVLLGWGVRTPVAVWSWRGTPLGVVTWVRSAEGRRLEWGIVTPDT